MFTAGKSKRKVNLAKAPKYVMTIPWVNQKGKENYGIMQQGGQITENFGCWASKTIQNSGFQGG